MRDEQPGATTAYICPKCGGVTSWVATGENSGEYRCHIGHCFAPDELWREHGAAPHYAFSAAARSAAEHAALARELAARVRSCGREDLAEPLDRAGRADEGYADELPRMLERIALGDAAASPRS